MIIGVFDSGRGGELLAQEIRAALATHEVITELDIENVPYGTKSPEEIYELTRQGIERLIRRGVTVVVLACNTASTLVDRLRIEFAQPIVALEPMIKPAARETHTGVIAVFATPATLASERYQELKQTYASNLTVLEPDTARWSTMIQREHIDWAEIEHVVQSVLDDGADVVVLGCTHYHVLEQQLAQMTKKQAMVLQPSQAIIARLKALLG